MKDSISGFDRRLHKPTSDPSATAKDPGIQCDGLPSPTLTRQSSL